MKPSIFRLKINTQINTSFVIFLFRNLRTIFNSAIGLLYESRRSLYFHNNSPPPKKTTHTHTQQKNPHRNKNKNKNKKTKQNKHPDPMQNPYMFAIYNDCTPTYCSLLVFHTFSDELPHIKEERVKQYTFYQSIICFHLF